MDLQQRILRFEREFYRLFATPVATTFGLLYYNTENPNSYDSNHAHIASISDPDTALEFIEIFYRSHGLRPRIYMQTEEELLRLKPLLEHRGFTTSSDHLNLLLIKKDSDTSQIENLSIKMITSDIELTEQIKNIFYAVDKGEWNIKATEYALHSPNYALFVCYEKECPVSVAALQVDHELKIARVDNVMTHPDYRSHGYCHQTMNQLIQYHKTAFDYPLYLYAENPIAINIYESVGFEKKELGLCPYSAWKEWDSSN